MQPNANPEVIDTAGAHDGPIETDAVIIGAGPVGLFQVFELGLLELKAHVIDSLAYPGGQPIELYPDKPIYDIPGLPFCTGRELTERLLQQIQPFDATLHLNQEVASVERQPDQRFLVKYMPRLEAFFHYRNLDVSTLKELSRRWRPEVYESFKKQQRHTALADVHESIDDMAHYREHFLKL